MIQTVILSTLESQWKILNNVVNWCKNKIKNADKIIKNGKNWYVYNGNCIITINANSYTIITAKYVKNKK